jgi:N6-L-threonylcarbamoyladenine synthase
MKVLGIETSCDETAAAIVSAERKIHANLVLSQLDEHRPYGGVVPEIAARSHLDHIDGLVARALDEAGLGFGDLDGVAATAGPGLIGGVFVGVMTAKAIAAARKLPFLAINHLEGHALTVRLTHGIDFPYLLLLVSGGHCQLLAVEGVGCYRRLGGTIDDAVGEAFDKSAKLLGLDYPGGPALERAARDGAPSRFDLPRPMVGRVGDVLVDRSGRALAIFQERYGQSGPLVVAGGVAANLYLRQRLTELAAGEGAELMAPPTHLCTDNGAMIAWAGIERLGLGLVDPLHFAPRPRWPLESLAQESRAQESCAQASSAQASPVQAAPVP